MEITVKPKWILSNDWLFSASGHEIGRIVLPWSYYFINYGRASLKFENSLFDITFPRRSVDYLGSKECHIKLIQNNEDIAFLKPLYDFSTEETQTSWGNRKLNCKLIEIGKWHVKDGGEKVGEISCSLTSRLRKLSFHEDIPFHIQSLIFWGTVQVKLTRINI